MVAVVAIESGIPPQTLWEADPRDFATLVDVLVERNRRR